MFAECSLNDNILPECSLLQVYSLPTKGLSLATAFALMETARKEYNVREYFISQPTLEQVFVRLAHT
jgi:hypothetical protein